MYASKCNDKLVKNNGDVNENNTEGNDNYAKKVQVDNKAIKHAKIKDANEVCPVKQKIHLTRQSSYSFSSVHKFCDNTHSFIAKVNEVE